ncbi:hypothetical protein QQM79_13005 [Marinobacteraceae bacterium S3BR75-40.1]
MSQQGKARMGFRGACLALSLSISGCAQLTTSVPSADPALKAKADGARESYQECMESAAAHYLASEASAEALAMAAQSRCERAWGEYRRAFTAQLQGLVSEDSQTMARRRARANAEETRRRMRDQVVQWVIDARMAP